MPSRAEAAPSHLWVPELTAAGAEVELSSAESHYLTRVCRARAGDRASATDGRGALAELRLERVGARVLATVERLEHCARTREAWVCAGAPEGRRDDWLIEKLAELGVSVFQPVDAERVGWRMSRGTLERWRRLAVAALRQSRRRFLLEVREPATIAELGARLPAGGSRWLAEPTGAGGSVPPRGPGVAVAAVGPSSGFTAAERGALAGLDFAPISLSDGRLRTETAAVAWAAWWAQGGETSAVVAGAGRAP